jgi:4-amino-4-deoxy-L-arabinose transferase-like glycosyltransferase
MVLSSTTDAQSTRPAFSRIGWLLVVVMATALWFVDLGGRALQHPDEGRYAEIAREMLVTHDFLTPRLNGLKYFEKPPLQYWMTAGSFAVLGTTEGAARFASVLATWLAVLIIGYAGWRIASPTIGIYAALALAGSIWYFGLAHILTVDALLCACLAIALAAFLVAQTSTISRVQRRCWMLIAWIAIAGAMLTKGLVALAIPGASLVLYSLFTRDWAVWKRLELLAGVLVFAVVAGPWFLLVSQANPEFAHFFFVHEHFERFLTTEHRRIGAWWYFVPLFLVGLIPWIGIFLSGLRGAWRMPADPDTRFGWARFCLVWVAFVFLFFSASSSKLPSYILPLFPAAALVIGWRLATIERGTLFALALPLPIGVAILLALTVFSYDDAVVRIANAESPAELYFAGKPWIEAALITGFVGYSVATVASRRAGAVARGTFVALLALTTIAMCQLLLAGADVFRLTRSTADLVPRVIADPVRPYDPTAPFYQVETYDQTLPFYLGRTTTLVAYRDELSLGLDLEPEKGIDHEDDWVARWRGLPQGYALLTPQTLERLGAAGLPYREVVRDPRHVVIARN